MSNHIDPKIQEIIDRHAAATPGPWYYDLGGYSKSSIVYDKNDVIVCSLPCHSREVLEVDAAFISGSRADMAYLLSEYKRLQNEVEFWKQAADNQRDNNYLLLKDRAVMKDAFDTIGDILTDDTSTKAIEINQTINLALSHLKGE